MDKKEETQSAPEWPAEVSHQPEALHKKRFRFGLHLNLVTILAILPFCTLLVAGSLFWYASSHTHKQTAANTAPTSSTDPKAQREKIATTTVYELGTGKYTAPAAPKSRVTHDIPGKLLLATAPDGNTTYAIAVSSTTPAENLKPADGWTIDQIHTDSMWEPASCAQNPSFIVENRYIFINDGSYNNGEGINYYTVFDMQEKTFRYFAEKRTNDLTSQEQIIGMNVEGGKPVVYLDYRDQSGPFTNSTSFKHRKGKDIKAVVRRVLNLKDLTYADYRVPFGDSPYEDYYLKVALGTNESYLMLSTDGGMPLDYRALIEPNKTLSLTKTTATIAYNPDRSGIQGAVKRSLPSLGDGYESFTLGSFEGGLR
jgi:hypothetical protein